MKLKVPVFKAVNGFLIRQEERITYYISGIHFTDKKSAISHYKNLRERMINSIKILDEEYEKIKND